jgi:hypothetical protein
LRLRCFRERCPNKFNLAHQVMSTLNPCAVPFELSRPPVHQPASIRSLTPELLLRVLELASEGDTTRDFSKRRNLLRRTSLVARKWRTLSQTLLLTCVYVNGRRARDGWPDKVLGAFGLVGQVTCERLVLEGVAVGDYVRLLARPLTITELVLIDCALSTGLGTLFGLDGVTSEWPDQSPRRNSPTLQADVF